MNPTSIDRVKKLLKDSQKTIEAGLRKQLLVYDKIKDNKQRKKSKSTFLLAFRSIFNDSINEVIAEVCRDKRLAAKIEESGKDLFGVARKSGLSEEDVQSAIDEINIVSEDVKGRIAKALQCEIVDIFD